MSTAGTEFSALALSTIAVLTLSATSIEASALYAVGFLAGALTAPAAGTLIDRVTRPGPTLIGIEVLHALVVAVIPLASLLDLMSLPLVFAVASISGALGALNRVGTQAMVREIVRADEDLVSANAAVTGGGSVARMVAPGLAGWAVQGLGAAMAMVFDAASYLVSAVALARLPPVRRAPSAHESRASMISDLTAAAATIRARPVLLRIMLMSAVLNVGGAGLGGLFYLYAYTTLHLSPMQIGITIAVHSAAAVAGAFMARRISARLGLERVIPTFAPIAAAALFLIPAAVWAPMPALIVYEAVFGFCVSVWAISAATMQQQVAPPGMLAKIVGLSQASATIVIPVGAITGGVIASTWGMLPTLVLFSAVTLVGTTVVSPRWGPWRSGARPS